MKLSDFLQIVIPFTGLIVAIIAGFFAFIGHWISRSNAQLAAKIAEDNARLSARLESTKVLAANRQAWINCLRDDMAKFFALNVEKQNSDIDHSAVFEVGMRIEMRINPNDPDYVLLQESMNAIANEPDIEKQFGGMVTYTTTCQRILKREWDVLRDELRLVGSRETDKGK